MIVASSTETTRTAFPDQREIELRIAQARAMRARYIRQTALSAWTWLIERTRVRVARPA